MTATVHATVVALAGRAVLLLGPSGAGKSDLALRLIDRGWRLVADDRAALTVRGGVLWASAPPPIAGLIEVRGVGIVSETALGAAAVALAIDLSAPLERLPDVTTRDFAGIAVPMIALSSEGESAPLKVERALQAHGAAVKADVSTAYPIMVVSGMSGAGKSSALKALEDMGYEAVDNLPLGLVEALLDRPARRGHWRSASTPGRGPSMPTHWWHCCAGCAAPIPTSGCFMSTVPTRNWRGAVRKPAAAIHSPPIALPPTASAANAP